MRCDTCPNTDAAECVGCNGWREAQKIDTYIPLQFYKCKNPPIDEKPVEFVTRYGHTTFPRG